MSNEDGSEDRLTKGEFAELIQHLSVQEILTIEYRIGTNWNKLFARKNVSTHIFVCNLCVLETSSFKSLLSHIDGRKHRLQMERVKQLYHPDYTYPKNDKKELIEKCVTKKYENAFISCTNNGQGQQSISTQQTVLINNDKENNENKTLQNKEKNKMPVTKSGTKIGSNNTVDTSATIIKQNTLNYSIKTSTVIEKQNEKEESTTTCNDISNLDEIKNSCTANQKVNTDKNQSTKNSEEETINSESNHKETKKTSPVVAKKRSLSDKKLEEEVELKNSKIIINPAAALSLKANTISVNDANGEDNSEKPRYQTGKIIIPTVHKNKSDSNKPSSPSTSQTHSNDFPKFSVKLYSSKPSDNDIHGILGVEYVIKILKSRNDISPRYECGLCELVLDGFAMQKHLEGYNHRLKFCEKHFPTAIRHCRQYMQIVPESELFKVMTPVLAKLAIAIEQHHGRNLPYECYERDFNLNRHEILAKAFSCRHASEQYGPTFTHVVSSKEIDEYINNRHKYLPPTSSRSAIFDMKPGSSSSRSDIRHQSSRISEKEYNSRHRHACRENSNSDVLKPIDTYKSYMSFGLHEEMYPPSGYFNQTDNRNIQNVQHVDDETYNLMVDDFLKGTLKGVSGNNRLRDHRKRSSSPARNVSSVKRRSLSPLRQNDIWQAYRHMVDQELYNLEERFKQYRKDPETHPSYNEEWQKFWKRRKDELVSAGLDHRKYNYQPEWVRFIKIRIEELYGQEVENIKIKSRERLCLPMSNDNVSDVKYQVQAPIISTSNEKITSTNKAGVTANLPNSSTSLSPSNDSIPQVVSVLRLMIALEDSLGSLGPKIIDLLSKALQAEKSNPLNVNAIILDDNNCSLIETAKEKFKGLVLTGLFEGSKKRVLKQVVNDAEVLLNYAYQFRQLLASKRCSIESSTNQTQTTAPFSLGSSSANFSGIVQNEPTQRETTNPSLRKSQSATSSKTENMLTLVDKKELASKLAASLVAQGKTDFDPQQLQQLIAVYKLIEKKKRESAGVVLTNKGGSSLPESSSSNKKTLSDTLSDLLKSSNSNDTNKSKTPQSALGFSNQILGNRQMSSNVDDIFQQNSSRNSTAVPSNSLTSVLQNPNDNYFNNSAQSMTNAYGVSVEGGNLLKQRNDYGLNYINNLPAHQQNSSLANMYNNQYQNNRTTQNWAWNSNMEMNQNYNIGGPSNYNKNNWQNF